MESICRACLKENIQQYSLFDIYENDISLAVILNQFTEKKVSKEDKLPDLLCESCTDILIQFHNFILTYETSTKTLTSLQNALNTKPDVVQLDEPNSTLKAEETSKSVDSIDFKADKPTKTHHDYICHVCGKTCCKESVLRDHIDSHSTELKYSCKVCNKRLKSRTSLSRHLKAHNQQNHWICEVCGRKFTHLSTLRTHNIQLHSSEKKFHCVVCDRRFSLKSTLKKHMLRHQNREKNSEKKFKCSQCNMGYLDKSSLLRHIQIKHEDSDGFRCEICDVLLNTKSNLLRHRRTIHISDFAFHDI